jgi:hypothetical protein
MINITLPRLYSFLLQVYPRPFSAEFGDEMQAVFTQRLADLGSGSQLLRRRIGMLKLFLGEIWTLPAALLDVRRYVAETGGGGGVSSSVSIEEGEGAVAWTGKRSSWGEALLGALPFLLFGLAYLFKGMTELGYFGNSTDWGLNFYRYILPGAYLIILVGLLIGWLKGFPRWSYAYLGMAFFGGWYYSNGRFHGWDPEWRAWIPLILMVVIALLITRSLRPLERLVKGVWNDWTRLSFALYAWGPMLTVTFFDMEWGITELVWMCIDITLLAVGAIAFLRGKEIWQRAVSLEAVLILLLFRFILMSESPPGGRPLDLVVILSILLFFSCILLLPSLLGLLRRGVGYLSTR